MILQSPLSLEQATAGLARIWLDTHADDSQVRKAAADWLSAHADSADAGHLQALSQSFEALRWPLTRPFSHECLVATDALLQSVGAQGWPRALHLAEAAWAWSRVYRIASQPAALRLLLAQATAASAAESLDEAAPAVERVWTDIALGALHCVAGDYPRALDCGLRAESLAAETDFDIARAKAAQSLAFVYLSVGDVEGACVVLSPHIQRAGHCGRDNFGMHFNYLLALLVGQRFEEADARLRAQPSLLDASLHVGAGLNLSSFSRSERACSS